MTGSPVTVTLEEDAAHFRHGEVEVGRYVLDDPFKPYLHPLRTVHGDVASLAIPHDHRHHKGLMFSLMTDRGNFWEEEPTKSAPLVGRQRSDALAVLPDSEGTGLVQHLTWHVDEQEIFTERRTISCQVADDTVTWLWATALRARLPVTLLQSEWSARDTNGDLVNYHGLGLRMPRALEVAGEASWAIVDRVPTTIAQAMGSTAREVGLSGPTDGFWPPRRIEVRMRQGDRDDAFFVSRDPLAYLSVGPSTISPRSFAAGETYEARFDIDVRTVLPIP